jgi:hypothetical protein
MRSPAHYRNYEAPREPVQTGNIEIVTTTSLPSYIKQCQQLVLVAAQNKNILQHVEGLLYIVQFLAIEKEATNNSEKEADLLEAGKNTLAELKAPTLSHPDQTKPITNETKAIEKFLNSSDFYSPVFKGGMKIIVQVMARKMGGATGH